jgi:hypothetical protein
VHACLRIDPGDRPQSMHALEELLGEDASAVAALPLPERTLVGCPAPVTAGASVLQSSEAMRAVEGETPQSMVITEMGSPPFAGSDVAPLPEPTPVATKTRRRRWRAFALLMALAALVPVGIAAAIRTAAPEAPSSRASTGDHPEALLTADPPPPSTAALPAPACVRLGHGPEFRLRHVQTVQPGSRQQIALREAALCAEGV